MSNENKSVFRVIHEKGVAMVAVALLAASLLAGLAFPLVPTAPALAWPPGPGAPVASLAWPPGPGAPAHADTPPGPSAPAHA
jgi:hypothetical protein